MKTNNNLTTITCFELPMSSIGVDYWWCPNDYEYGVLKEYIDSIYHGDPSGKSTTPLPMITDKKCSNMTDPILMIVLVGILLLMVINLQIIYLINYFASRIATEQRQNPSLQYEEIIYNENDTQPEKEERFMVVMNLTEENQTRTTHV
ncbi:unnamed protein product [Rotaria sp. Silwood2]|nr:unnamed protein product [Rotaria sp. Silwood2]CAF3008371.1 unnamed protein product [Rotaria sp. Silwood2]CAF3311393.1 unnamed protein product [Rotaria sp. Silwood2]CAF3317930.1 unnamed protein product [Rotaria sp. Silwood2]CAF3931534.1 unnamed protein product [Rotaria sp. Silwood2]